MITPTQKWRKYRTERGICINEDCEKVIQKYLAPNFEGKIQLILTSPPFPLKRAKKYGNKVGKEYLDWLCNIGNQLAPLLSQDGSIVIEIGNAWNPGSCRVRTKRHRGRQVRSSAQRHQREDRGRTGGSGAEDSGDFRDHPERDVRACKGTPRRAYLGCPQL